MATLPNPKKKRTHLPALPPNKLREALDKLPALPISKEAQRVIADSLKAAANPDNERIDVVIATLPKNRKRNVGKTRQGVSRVTNGVVSRGKKALMDMDAAEWERLVNQANEE